MSSVGRILRPMRELGVTYTAAELRELRARAYRKKLRELIVAHLLEDA